MSKRTSRPEPADTALVLADLDRYLSSWAALMARCPTDRRGELEQALDDEQEF